MPAAHATSHQRSPRRQPKILTPQERDGLLAQFNRRYNAPLRNLCMVQLMLDAGLRTGEVLALRPEHLDMMTCRLVVREGKGAKDRTLWVSRDLRDLIGRWLQRRPESEWLFCTRHGGPVQARYLREMVKRMARRAGIAEWQRVSPHALRHTFASDLHRETGNLRLVQLALGHADLRTTAIHVHLLDGELEQALKSFRQSEQPGQDTPTPQEIAHHLLDALPEPIAQALARAAQVPRQRHLPSPPLPLPANPTNTPRSHTCMRPEREAHEGL